MNGICLINQSTVVPGLTGAVLDQIAAAVTRQLVEHYGPFWQSQGIGLRTITDPSQGGANELLMTVLDNADQAGELGYHATLVDGRPYSRIFAGPIMANGGSIMGGPNSLSCTISHEALEAIGDPYCVWWADMPDGQTEDALELCDRTESDSYEIDGVAVSNFLGPRAFSDGAGPFDWMSLMTAPFQVRPGGYAIRRTGGPGGSTSSVWGATYPEWKRAGKAFPAARTSRRGAHP